MKIKMIVLSVLLGLVFSACNSTQQITRIGWQRDSQVYKTIDNVHFTFPSSTFTFREKKRYIQQCFTAMEENAKMIELGEFKVPIYIRFLSSRKESVKYTGQLSKGSAWPHIRTLYVVANDNDRPPIKHELMHLMSMLKWGYEHPSTHWVNEGLGTFAENNCNGYSVSELYRYFMETDKLIAIELLVSDFYNQPDMIAYHQTACIVEYLLANYSVEQLKRLWKEGHDKFEDIYGIAFSEMLINLEKSSCQKASDFTKDHMGNIQQWM